MKKIQCIVLIIVLLTSLTIPAIAISENSNIANIDFNNLSDDELVSLYHRVQSALLARNSENTLRLNAGHFNVGKDFPAGVYRFECEGVFSSCTLKVYSAGKSYPRETYMMGEIYNSSIISRLELNKGDILDISGSALTVSSYNAAQIDMSLSDSSTKDVGISKKGAGEDGLTISSGKYLIGSEIPAGVYRIVCDSVYNVVSVRVYDKKDSIFPAFDTILAPMIGNSEIGKIELKKGQYLEIKEGTVKLYDYEGISK